jgi:ribonuclease D
MTVAFTLIDNEESLSQVCAQLKDSTWLAVDTEFERVSTYYPELCLVQISDGINTVIIDPLAINDLEPLFDLLYQKTITKVLHSARQDLEIFFHIKGTVPTPLFDTQIAAPALGYAKGIGYGNLIKEVMSIELDKGHARTNWKQRPLTEKQLRYAADDAIYLAKAYEVFIKKLIEEETLSSLDEQLAVLEKPETYLPDPEKMWKKIFAARKLKGKQLAVVKQLAAWREMTARERNRPRKWILPDHSLIALATQLPANKSDLLQIDKVGEKTVSRHGDDLLKIMHDAQ